jgi:hypothetical protein
MQAGGRADGRTDGQDKTVLENFFGLDEKILVYFRKLTI